jgi:hypothetical protein
MGKVTMERTKPIDLNDPARKKKQAKALLKSFKPGKAKSIKDLEEYIQAIANIVAD